MSPPFFRAPTWVYFNAKRKGKVGWEVGKGREREGGATKFELEIK